MLQSWQRCAINLLCSIRSLPYSPCSHQLTGIHLFYITHENYLHHIQARTTLVTRTILILELIQLKSTTIWFTLILNYFITLSTGGPLLSPNSVVEMYHVVHIWETLTVNQYIIKTHYLTLSHIKHNIIPGTFLMIYKLDAYK